MTTGKDLAMAACPYLGRKYSEMDCQAFIEKALSDTGLFLNLAGSNAWYREVMKNGWVGTPEDCIRKYGTIPQGAFLFILSFNGKEPENYKDDGLGNASHIGIFTGMTGQEMIDIAFAAGNTNAVSYYYGNGAIHSSASRGFVATSDFKSKSIKGGWNVVGLWNRIDYGIKITEPEPQPEPEQKTNTGTATVWAKTGSNVNMRKDKSTSAALVNRVPIGSAVTVLKQENNWSKIVYIDKLGASWVGWMMDEFLIHADLDSDGMSYTVTIHVSSKAEAEKLISMYPGATMEPGVG